MIICGLLNQYTQVSQPFSQDCRLGGASLVMTNKKWVLLDISVSISRSGKRIWPGSLAMMNYRNNRGSCCWTNQKRNDVIHNQRGCRIFEHLFMKYCGDILREFFYPGEQNLTIRPFQFQILV